MPDPKDKLPLIPEQGKEKLTADILAENEDFKRNAGKIIAQASANPYAELQPAAYDPKSTTDINKNYERYYSHPSFKKLGFNPWSDNESLYNQQGSASGDVARAAIAGMKLAVTGFKSPLRSYADIFTGDALRNDEATAKEMKYLNTVGSSSRGGPSGFISNLAVNSGFSVGFMGEAIAEQAALTAVTALTGGSTSGVQAIRAAKTVKDFGTYAKIIRGLSEATKAISEYPAAKAVYDGFKTVGKFVSPFANTASALNESKNLAGLAKISQTAGGFFRDVSAANFTLAEAKVEGASAQMDTEDELIREFKDKNNGRAPSYNELLQIKEAAKTAGDKTLAFNIPAIFLTNKLTFAPLLNSFTKSGANILKNGVKFIEKEGEGLVEAGLLQKAKIALKPKNLWKAPLTYFAGNLSEGVQETTQEIVSGAAKDYYKNIYNSSVNKGITFAQAENQNYGGGGWDAIANNAKNQFSGKGFETFASGFFMGGLLKVASLPITAARMGFSEYKKTKNEYTTRTLEAANEIYKDPLKWFAPQSLNYSATANGIESQTEAENDDNQKMWSDFEDQNTWSHLTTALDSGTYDILVDKLRKIKTMTPEAINEAYGQDGHAVLSKIDRIIQRAENLKNNYNKWNERASNPFNPKAYKKDTPEYNKETISFLAWEAAKKSAVFQDYSFTRNAQRIDAVTQDILKTPEFKSLNPNDVSVLYDPTQLRNELGLLDNEIEVLRDSEIPGDVATLRVKETKRDRLLTFRDKLQNYYVTQQLSNLTEEDKKAHPELVEKLKGKEFKKTTQAQLKTAYENYVKHLGTQVNVIHITQPNLDSSFKQLLDIHELKQENLHLTQAVNLLSNPKGFTDHYKALFDTFSELYNNREDIIRQSIEDTQKKIELNVGLLKPLYDRGFVVDSKNLDGLIERGEIPSEFYDLNAKQVVTSADPFRYSQFQEIVNNYVEATQPETKPEESVSTPPTEEGVVTPPAGEIEPVITPVEEVRPLSLDILKKFDEVKTEEQLLNLEEDLTALMSNTTLEERLRAGLNSKNIDDKLKEKRQELSENITMENLQVGDILNMVNPDYGTMKVVRKTSNKLTVQKLGDGNLKVTIDADKLKQNIKSKYSEAMTKETVSATSDEKTKVKENVTKVEKFTDNRDLLEEVMAEAYKDEKKFEKDFMDNLGCK